MKHPLEPLTKQEIETASDLFRSSFHGHYQSISFSNAQLIEPSKEQVRKFNNEDDGIEVCHRKVRLVGTGVWPGLGCGGFSAIVDLTNKVLSNS